MGSPPLSWRVPPSLDIRTRQWDAQAVVYHCHSGDTFLLDALSWQIFHELHCGDGPLVSLDVAKRLSIPADESDLVEDRLEELRLRGLVERIALC